MRVRVVTVEREYGCGGSVIARLLADRLGWKLWDEELTAEIARIAQVDHKVAACCDERVDSWLYRLFKVYARGSYERALPISEARPFDTDRMFSTLEQVVRDVSSRGPCVIVGRGSPYFLRDQPDAFRVFIYASAEEKLRRLMAMGHSEREARQSIEEIDRDRAAFIRHYFGVEWPYRPLYDLMINAKMGDDFAVEMVLQHIANAEKSIPREAASV